MFKLTLKVNGQEIRPEEIADPLRKMAIEDMRTQLRQKLRNVLCPEHHQTPEVTVLFQDGKQHIQVQGCCQRVVDMTMQALLHP